MDAFDDQLPQLGTKAAAVCSVESLIYHALGGEKVVDADMLRYWLDAYYQVRRMAEDRPHGEERIATPACALARNDKEEVQRADESAPPERESAEGKVRQRPVGWTDGSEPFELKRGKAAETAEYKRGVRERFLQLRAGGLTLPQVKKAVEGNISEDQILAILEGKRVPVAAYRVLAAGLDRIEDRETDCHGSVRAASQ